MDEFQQPEQHILGGPTSAFKQPASIIKPHAHVGTLSSTQLANKNNFANVLVNAIKSCLGQPPAQTQNKSKINPSATNTEDDLGF